MKRIIIALILLTACGPSVYYADMVSNGQIIGSANIVEEDVVRIALDVAYLLPGRHALSINDGCAGPILHSLPNIIATDAGTAILTLPAEGLTLRGRNSIVGKSLVISSADTILACGVIQ